MNSNQLAFYLKWMFGIVITFFKITYFIINYLMIVSVLTLKE